MGRVRATEKVSRGGEREGQFHVVLPMSDHYSKPLRFASSDFSNARASPDTTKTGCHQALLCFQGVGARWTQESVWSLPTPFAWKGNSSLPAASSLPPGLERRRHRTMGLHGNARPEYLHIPRHRASYVEHANPMPDVISRASGPTRHSSDV